MLVTHWKRRMNLFRTRLISILSVLALGTIAVCIATYLGIRHEMDELYDANMRQLASTASNMPLTKGKSAAALAYSDQWPRGEEVFLIQIWEDGKLEYSSHPVANFPLQEKSGHSRVFFNEKRWGYYQEESNGHIVQVSQELKVRREVIREVYNAVLIPILIQFPLLALLVWFFVGYGFRPLIRDFGPDPERTATFMAPIPPEDAPKEIRAMVLALNDLLQRLEMSLQTQRQFTADLRMNCAHLLPLYGFNSICSKERTNKKNAKRRSKHWSAVSTGAYALSSSFWNSRGRNRKMRSRNLRKQI